MMRNILKPACVLAILSIPACNGEEDLEEEDCENQIVTQFPEAGDTQAFYRTSVEVTFQTVDDGASVTLEGPDGKIDAESHWRNRTLVLDLAQPLSPTTEYTVNVDFECGEPSYSWTTSEVGNPVDISDIEPSAFALDLESGRFIEPQGVGDLLQQFVDQTVLVGVEELDGDDLFMLGAVAESGATEQDLCQPTIDFPVASFDDNPFFELGPENTTLEVEGYSVDIDDLELSGAFSPDGGYIDGAVLAGSVDTRPLVEFLPGDAVENGEEDPDDDAICALAESIGASCHECPTDGEPYCLTLRVDSIAADRVEGLELEPRDFDAIDDDPDCNGDED